MTRAINSCTHILHINNLWPECTDNRGLDLHPSS